MDGIVVAGDDVEVGTVVVDGAVVVDGTVGAADKGVRTVVDGKIVVTCTVVTDATGAHGGVVLVASVVLVGGMTAGTSAVVLVCD